MAAQSARKPTPCLSCATPRRSIDTALNLAAALFPMLPDDELEDLAEDTSRNGLLQPIVLDSDGLILDRRSGQSFRIALR